MVGERRGGLGGLENLWEFFDCAKALGLDRWEHER